MMWPSYTSNNTSILVHVNKNSWSSWCRQQQLPNVEVTKIVISHDMAPIKKVWFSLSYLAFQDEIKSFVKLSRNLSPMYLSFKRADVGNNSSNELKFTLYKRHGWWRRRGKMKIGRARAIFARDFFFSDWKWGLWSAAASRHHHYNSAAAAFWYHDEIIIPNEIGVMVWWCGLHQLPIRYRYAMLTNRGEIHYIAVDDIQGPPPFIMWKKKKVSITFTELNPQLEF